MSRRDIQLDDRTVIFSPDDPVPLVGRIQALYKLRITDELTGKPPETTINLRVEEKNFTPRVASDGIAGLVGIPQQVIPRLDAQNYPITLTVSAAGYLSRELDEQIPQDPNFPQSFSAQELSLSLHREPVTIFGRTVRVEGNASTPLPNTQVTVTGIWRVAPPFNAVVPPDVPNIVAVQPPLYVDRDAVTQTLQPVDLTAAAVTEKRLMNNVSSGIDSIQLSDRQGLAAGGVLQIDVDQPDLTEFIEIKSVPTTSSPDQPTLITLNQKLLQAHLRDARVKLALVLPAGLQRPFTVDAVAGDTCIFLDDLVSLPTGQTVQITGVTNKDEFHTVSNFSVFSDAQGYYQLPPLSRVAQLEIHAEKTVGIQTFEVITVFRPDYRPRENHLDLTLAAP
jgi:hypothetical protein